MHFHINPYSQYSRDFSPLEAKSLLAIGEIVFLQHIHTPPNEVLHAAFARNFDIRAVDVAELRRKSAGSQHNTLHCGWST